MILFWKNAFFFIVSLFNFMLMFFTVWLPGFILAAVLALRFRRPAWDRLAESSATSGMSIFRAVLAGMLGSTNRELSWQVAWDLLQKGHRPATVISYLIASRNMTIIFFSIFTLSLGIEFAIGHVLGALVMIGVVCLTLRWFPVKVQYYPEPQKPSLKGGLQMINISSWSALLLTGKGWWATLKFIGREVRGFAVTLLVGIAIAGVIFAAGMESWWPLFAEILGRYTFVSDLINSLTAPFLSAAIFLSPVGNLPVIHALFKTDGLAYPGIISFCLASIIHPKDLRIYFKTFGKKQGTILVCLLYFGAVAGGFGSTWLYALAGFRPELPPLELFKRILALITG